MKTIAGLALAALLAFLTAPALADPIQVDGGLVSGTAQDGIRVYKGIPFAAPPVGDLRWRPPAPVVPWTGVKQATGFAPACDQFQTPAPQFGIPLVPTSEDCLYLNIWTPAASADAHLPVMVWIYGGGFTQGATSIPAYDGTGLAKKGVVLVSIAYRVGSLGFLAHPELSAESPTHSSGTYGLMDQIAALQWVQHNIAAFGGDPDCVTIFGESAGGISVSMLAASPRAKGLFQRAISESGGSFAPPKTKAVEGGVNVPSLAMAEQQGEAFLDKLGVASIAEARKLPADTVAQAAGPQLGVFWPALDGDVLPDDQYLLYAAGKYNDVPVLIGTNDDEGAPFVLATTAEKYKAGVDAAYGAMAANILAAYPAISDSIALRSARDLFRDDAFAWHTWTWARLQSRTGKSKVFVYYFTHRPPYPDIPLLKDWGAGHGAEIGYVFGTHLGPWSDADKAMSDRVQDYWVQFAKTGDPNGNGEPQWPAYTEAAPSYLKLDNDAKPIPVPNLDQLKTLDDYYAWRRRQIAP